MNPLEQLQPLITPEAPSLWPPAIGWWLLPFVIVLLIWGLWRLIRYLRQRQQHTPKAVLDPLRQAALDELLQLPKPYGASANLWLQQLNALLKRLCRVQYPNDQSHLLSGRAWLAYLDNRCPAAGLTRWMILAEGSYRPNTQMSDEAIDSLEQAIAIWIRKHV